MSESIHHTNISSIATFIPECKTSTDELIDKFKDCLSEELQMTLNRLGVLNRYSIIKNFPDYLSGKIERQLIDSTTSMATKAILKCLEKSKQGSKDLGLLIAITNTANRPLPCMAFEIVSELGDLIPHDINIINMQNQGCAVLLKAIELASCYLVANPDKTVMIVGSESHTGYIHSIPKKPYYGLHELKKLPDANIKLQETMEVISFFLFGDGAFAMLLDNQGYQNHSGFSSIAHLTNIEAFDAELLTLNEGGILQPTIPNFPHYYMNEKVPSKGAAYSKKVLASLIQNKREISSPNDAQMFFIHTGSKKILDAICRTIAVDQNSDQTKWSYEILKEYGNLSSCSIGFMLSDYLESRKHTTSSLAGLLTGLIISFGVGFSASAGLVHL
ncbi:3-oxoacyl-ACP synthase [Candidatus Protochlamydia naegleriophila]|uniref:3-oxoacyl-ACP synthase n=1 Tax=Candidatus Protochlamydia naegleriophila TaxID=389348 RepID=A0A0U5ERS3_9BACT|nr:3-oxoacyl-[acyl-carrier-protein] synthase III C-terminal domain-containing protein [Candidatus Protochlamydia naegleriophila]CUI16880.1 3-oxoacyl-ACP synthase [Candidatus Protochlamydia naegleriophila]